MKENIANFDVYNKRMEKSLEDKLFFVNILKDEDIETIIDFGCANGELLKWTKPEWNKIGIDNNPKMRIAAKENLSGANYINDFDELERCEFNKDKTVLNLCSVIHEIYSYCSNKDILNFWNHVFNDGYKYIVIRDMSVSKETERLVDENLIEKISDYVLNKKYEIKNAKRFLEHIEKCKNWRGKESPSVPFNNLRQKDAIHYLLKYRYTDNWSRESNENYLGLWTEDLIELIPEKYEIIYKEHYVLPFIKEDVMKNFNYELRDNTHIKLILKKKDEV